MLDPGNRTLLLESLRPPEGYSLDRAIGTSYSLDLLALLTALLAFTFFDWEDHEGRPTADPLALLEAVRRNARRISVFCQAGEIKLPPPGRQLLAYLEQCVIEVRAPRPDGIFHPKVWCLRFAAENSPVRYRVLCLTRNLTFDRCWDTVLRLDGELTDRQKGYASNRRLSEFVDELPRLAIRPVRPEVRVTVDTMAAELRRVDFALPLGVSEIAFWPLGLSGRQQRPFGDGKRRVLIMSPFLSAGLLDDITAGRTGSVLISRPDQLAELPKETLSRFDRVYAMDPAVDDWSESEDDRTDPGLAGLHAKLFIEDEGRYARVFTGSANATRAAFHQNVELMVELIGKKGALGVGALMDSSNGDRNVFMGLLKAWNPPADFVTPDNSSQRALEKKLAKARCAIASSVLRMDATSDGGTYVVCVVAEQALEIDPDISLKFWPASVRPELAVTLSTRNGVLATFPAMPLAALNGFIGCEVSATHEGLVGTSQFAMNVPLIGLPEDRLDRLLAAIVNDKDQLRRLIWLLLEGQTDTFIGAFQNGGGVGSRPQRPTSIDGYPLFERLVGTLAEDPGRLKEIGRLIKDFAQTSEGKSVLPDGLLALWQSLEAAMEDPGEQAGST